MSIKQPLGRKKQDEILESIARKSRTAQYPDLDNLRGRVTRMPVRAEQIDYQPEPFDLTRPPHLLAKDLLERIGMRGGVDFGRDSHADVEQLIRQLTNRL